MTSSAHPKIGPEHVARRALVYLRQSSQRQVLENTESQRLQYALADRARELGFQDVEVIDADLEAVGSLRDTKIVFRAGGQELTILHSTWYSGYIPTALLIALMLATPLRWPLRLRALGWGLLIVNLYLALRMGSTFIAGGAIDPLHWLPAPGFRRSLFSSLAVTGPGSGLWYVVPLLTWILLVHRRVYQEVVVGAGNGPTPSEPSDA